MKYTDVIAFIKNTTENINNDTFNHFILLLTDLGATIDLNISTQQFIKVYSNKDINIKLIQLFNDCQNNIWGKQLKNFTENYIVNGPHELKNILEI